MIKQIICLGLLIGILFLVGCQSVEKYDEVIYDCGSRLLKGTEIPNSELDLENEVDVYYLYPDNYSIKYNYSMREWFSNFNAVGLEKGEGGCKEILRFSNYTKIVSD